MFDNNFDPLKVLETLEKNQTQLFHNQNQLNNNLNVLATRINEMQAALDTLVGGIEAANKANELLMQSMVGKITSSLERDFGQGQKQ